MPAELPLVPSAMALAFSALLFFLPARSQLAHRAGALLVLIGSAIPIALDPLIDPTHASGRALWEWSAVGGPTIQASYEVDALAAVALSLTVAFAGAALATAGRTERRHPALAALVLALGLVTIAVVVTNDLVAAVVVLAVVGILTVLALFAVAPAPATARAAGYLSMGLQAWMLAALLVSRHGSPTFVLHDVPATAISAGAILAATLGALLFAGLYPVVAWTITESEAGADPGRLGSLVLMPAGISASLLLVRLLGASDVDPTTIALPEVGGEIRLALVVVVLATVALAVGLSGQIPRRPLGVGAIVVFVLATYPLMGWAHVVLLAAILTAAYAAVVSLAMPDQWETVRGDLGQVALWIGIATASPLGVAGGVVALFARAASALAAGMWLVPHRDYIAFVGGSAVFIAGAIAAGVGATSADDPVVAALGVLAAALLILLEIAQVGRRFRIAVVPTDLDVTSGVVASLLAILAAIVLVPLESAVRQQLHGAEALSSASIAGMAIAAAAAVVLARTVRPLLPYFEAVAERSGPAMRALDPAPIGIGAFRILEALTTRAAGTFALFERRGGVWLATLLIVALLVWVVR
jgi:hypothetical protein